MTRAGTGKANLSDSRISFKDGNFLLIQEKIGNKSTKMPGEWSETIFMIKTCMVLIGIRCMINIFH